MYSILKTNEQNGCLTLKIIKSYYKYICVFVCFKCIVNEIQ